MSNPPSEDGPFIRRDGPMFRPISLNKAHIATDLAIPLLAAGGWDALTLRNVGRAARITPQAVAAWFPSVATMRSTIAGCYGERWIRERRRRAWSLATTPEAVAPVELACALLPQTCEEEIFDRIWLTILEAARWDESVGKAAADIVAAERDLVAELLRDPHGTPPEEPEPHVALVLALVHGVRAARCAPHLPMTVEQGEHAVRLGLSGPG